MNFKDCNLTLNTNKFEAFNNTEGIIINVLQYLPVVDKNDLIQITLQNSEENGIYNKVKMDMYFELYLVYMYSDIQFTDEEKEDEIALYDILKSSGVIDMIKAAIDKDEYNYLVQTLHDTAKQKTEYRNTISAVINGFIERMPINAEKAMEIINKFNPEDFQQVLQFARAANGDRPIN